MTRPICVLVGPPGAGKSTVGALVADKLGVSLRDTDSDLEAAAGKPISEIFIDDGEPQFRALECAAVAAALAEHGGVLALGGGAVLAPQTRELLRGHRVVYLSVELANAVKRVGLGAGRPLLALNPRATLKFLLEQRKPLYVEVCTIEMPTDGRTVEEIATDLADILGPGA